MTMERRAFLKHLGLVTAGTVLPIPGSPAAPANKSYPYLGRTEDYEEFRIIEPGLKITKLESWARRDFGIVRVTTFGTTSSG